MRANALFKQAVIGLSGGVDSALTACLAVLALGAQNVSGSQCPGRLTLPKALPTRVNSPRGLGLSFG